MTNLKYVEEVMNSNMSGEAMAMALSILVGREPNQRCRIIANAKDVIKNEPYWYRAKEGKGIEYSKNILNSRLLAIALPMLQDTENGVRAKDIAKAYNDSYNPWDELTYYDTRHILLKLLDCGIVKYEYKEEFVELENGKKIVARHRAYFLNI